MLLTSQLFAQIRIGVKGSLTNTSISLPTTVANYANIYDIVKSERSYICGVMIDLKITSSLNLRPNLLYKKIKWNVQGIQGAPSVAVVGAEQRFKVECMELPVYVIYSTPLGDGKLYISVGPYLSYALNGSYEYRDIYDNTFSKAELKFDKKGYTGKEELKYGIGNYFNYNIYRIDYGISSVFGYEFPFGLLIELGYDMGIRKVYVNPYDDTKFSKHNMYALNLGYFINRKRK